MVNLYTAAMGAAERAIKRAEDEVTTARKNMSELEALRDALSCVPADKVTRHFIHHGSLYGTIGSIALTVPSYDDACAIFAQFDLVSMRFVRFDGTSTIMMRGYDGKDARITGEATILPVWFTFQPGVDYQSPPKLHAVVRCGEVYWRLDVEVTGERAFATCSFEASRYEARKRVTRASFGNVPKGETRKYSAGSPYAHKSLTVYWRDDMSETAQKPLLERLREQCAVAMGDSQ